jgi:hypothetical protein
MSVTMKITVPLDPTPWRSGVEQNSEFFWTFSIVWYSKKHDVSETGSVSVLR